MPIEQARAIQRMGGKANAGKSRPSISRQFICFDCRKGPLKVFKKCRECQGLKGRAYYQLVKNDPVFKKKKATYNKTRDFRAAYLKYKKKRQAYARSRKEITAKYMLEYQRKNAAAINEKHAQWRSKNREKARRYGREWMQRNYYIMRYGRLAKVRTALNDLKKVLAQQPKTLKREGKNVRSNQSKRTSSIRAS